MVSLGGPLNLGFLGPLEEVLTPGSGYRLIPTGAGGAWVLPASRQALGALGGLVYPPNRRARWSLRALALGLRVGVGVEVAQSVRREMEGLLGLRDPQVAFYVGTPGAYRKAVVFVAGKGGESVVVKWALVPDADRVVEREWEVLRHLSETKELKGTMPQPLASGRWRGRTYLAMCPLKGRPEGRRLLGRHWHWAARIFAVERKVSLWEESPFRQTLGLRVSIVQPKVLTTAFEALDRMLEGRTLSFGWAHRDFTPWNLRVQGSSLGVLDWEMAVPVAPPGYDLLHFLALQAALQGKAVRWPFLELRKWLESVAPEWASLVKPLVLTYLLDQALFYAEARQRAPQVGEGRVLAWLVQQIEGEIGYVA